MATQSMWVHGNSATIELNGRGRGPGEDVEGREWTAIEGLRAGPGVIYRCQDDSDYWFHFAIPTPVVDDGVRARFRKVGLDFGADVGVTLSAVHVWDGRNRIFTRDGIGGGPGPHSFDLPDQEVAWGVGVSALFHFADPGNLTLHTAGVDFES